MKQVAKYNLFKGVSTLLTVGTPIATLACCSDFFVSRSDTAISAAGMFSILISALFFKDKIVENFKCPSAFIVSLISFVLVLIVENIIVPVKYVCLTSMIASGLDEMTFKQWYKTIKSYLPNCENYEKFGFIFTTTEKLMESKNE